LVADTLYVNDTPTVPLGVPLLTTGTTAIVLVPPAVVDPPNVVVVALVKLVPLNDGTLTVFPEVGVAETSATIQKYVAPTGNDIPSDENVTVPPAAIDAADTLLTGLPPGKVLEELVYSLKLLISPATKLPPAVKLIW
jgi:hypothetical protein